MEQEFATKDAFGQAFLKIMEPLMASYAAEPGHLDLGSHGTVYRHRKQKIEAYLRPLWGIAPYLTEQPSPLAEIYLTGISAGVDPESPYYWGEVTDYDQLIVEMAALSLLLLLNKETIWEAFSPKTQQQLHKWLMQVDQCQLPRNNWHFFRIIVHCAMKKCGMPYDPVQIEADFAVIDRFYCGEGWYFDGVATQRDYYVSFALHYYGLLYCSVMKEEDPKRVAVLRERACLFARSFKYWFSGTGEAVPFGRSLTYRFAQVAFFSALVFADVEALPWGEIKGIIQRHLTSWKQQAIFTADGRLSVGYFYENLVFAEGYNAPGSPYWSLKSFLLLAVPRDHPYWQAEAQELQTKQQVSSPVSRNFYRYNQDRRHLQIFPAGQFINYQSHASAKYSKFVYSTRFGFSVPKSNYWYYEGAYDNCLAVAEDDHYFRTKGLDDQFEILPDRILHLWYPWENVQIKTTIVPLEECHVRLHEIRTERPLTVYEGGFSVPFEEQKYDAFQAKIHSSIGQSALENLYGFQKAGVVRPEPNTNVCYPSTLLPYLSAVCTPGQHRLVSLVVGTLPGETFEVPRIQFTEEALKIQQAASQIEVTFDAHCSDG